MGTAILIIKLMPESPESNLDAIQSAVQTYLDTQSAKNISFEIKPIAFSLKSLTVKFDIDENKGSDAIEQELAKIPQVSSVTIEDYRRAFG